MKLDAQDEHDSAFTRKLLGWSCHLGLVAVGELRDAFSEWEWEVIFWIILPTLWGV